MGIPKFFRWISERYPMCSELVTEASVPEFDNFYLDMNGILHTCSHPSDNVHFRLSEAEMFTAIFQYIDLLFQRIQPKKLFFMALDGVAPRAKMNQQRARRFRTARDSAEQVAKAVARGEALPKEPAFDSNCITPGTEFMQRVNEHLKYFVCKKKSEDAAWRDVQVILSGPDVPGEGEHKIMAAIRDAKSKKEYDPNTRHCLYGLDADLIMLGLVTHDPHFALLREQVNFGPKRNNTATTATSAPVFFLLHLSLVREYLNAEFQQTLSQQLSFPYDFERILDDFILLAIFVGNDFVPHLPSLHIQEGAFGVLFETYKTLLPKLDGYLQTRGEMEWDRVVAFLKELALFEWTHFENLRSEATTGAGKSHKRHQESPEKQHLTHALSQVSQTSHANHSLPSMTLAQSKMIENVSQFIDSERRTIPLPEVQSQSDRQFMSQLARDVGLQYSVQVQGNGQQSVELRKPWEGEELEGEMNQQSDEESSEDEESLEAMKRVLKRYSQLPIKETETVGNNANNVIAKNDPFQDVLFLEWKKIYYADKLEAKTDQEIEIISFEYLRGVQWVLFYYYRGVCSWSWFYPFHYAPKMSDLFTLSWDRLKSISQSYSLDRPFQPFEQLMSVLPSASRHLLPSIYRDLMVDPVSPLFQYYPVEFECDLNGKKADWEAIVKIPFMDASLLVDTLRKRESGLNTTEKERNKFGVAWLFVKREDDKVESYPSSLPGHFPPILKCLCVLKPFALSWESHLSECPFVLHEKAKTSVQMCPGFPSLYALPVEMHLAKIQVKVFPGGHGSKSESLIVSIHEKVNGKNQQNWINKSDYEWDENTRQYVNDWIALLGQSVFVHYPQFHEARVESLITRDCTITLNKDKNSNQSKDMNNLVFMKHSSQDQIQFDRETEGIQFKEQEQRAILLNDICVLIQVRLVTGLSLLENGALVKKYSNELERMPSALCIRKSLENEHKIQYKEKEAVSLMELAPVKSRGVIVKVGPYFGSVAEVVQSEANSVKVQIVTVPRKNVSKSSLETVNYFPLFILAKKCQLSTSVASRLVSHFFCPISRCSIGLCLRSDARQERVLSYARYDAVTFQWEFSQKSVDLLLEYKRTFPWLMERMEQQKNETTTTTALVKNDQEKKEVSAKWNEWTGSLIRVSMEMECLELDQIASLAAMNDGRNDNASNSNPTSVLPLERSEWLLPATAHFRLSSDWSTFQLLDPVLIVSEACPLGLYHTGIVIAKHEDQLSLLLDHIHLLATSLQGLCPPHRGVMVKMNWCLNLNTSTRNANVKEQAVVSNTSTSTTKSGSQPNRPLNQSFVQIVKQQKEETTLSLDQLTNGLKSILLSNGNTNSPSRNNPNNISSNSNSNTVNNNSNANSNQNQRMIPHLNQSFVKATNVNSNNANANNVNNNSNGSNANVNNVNNNSNSNTNNANITNNANNYDRNNAGNKSYAKITKTNNTGTSSPMTSNNASANAMTSQSKYDEASLQLKLLLGVGSSSLTTSSNANENQGKQENNRKKKNQQGPLLHQVQQMQQGPIQQSIQQVQIQQQQQQPIQTLLESAPPLTQQQKRPTSAPRPLFMPPQVALRQATLKKG